MKSLFRPLVFALTATSVLAALSGCNSPGDDARPGEIRPGVTRSGTRPKSPQQAIPITVVKAASTPTAFPKGKKPVRRKSAELPANTSVPFTFSIASEFWPTGVTSVSAVVKCYQVASVYTVSGGYQITTTGSPLAVFGSQSTSQAVTITPSGPQTVYLTFPSSSCEGKQLFVGITGSGDDGETEYDFGGGEIFVVSQ